MPPTETIPVTSCEKLDSLRCGNPQCDHKHHERQLYLTSRCHAGDGLAASYEAGILTVRCATCLAFIVAVEVK